MQVVRPISTEDNQGVWSPIIGQETESLLEYFNLDHFKLPYRIG